MNPKTEENRSLQATDYDNDSAGDNDNHDAAPVRKKGDKRKTLLVLAGFLVALAALIVFNMK